MTNLHHLLKDHRESGAFHELIGIQATVDDQTFLTKGGHMFTVLRVAGIDDECLESGQRDQIARRVEAIFRQLDENFRIYQIAVKSDTNPIIPGVTESTVVNEALTERSRHLNGKRLQKIELFFVVVYEGLQLGKERPNLSELLRNPAKAIDRILSTEEMQRSLDAELERARQILSQRIAAVLVQIKDTIPVEVLNTQEAFLVLRRLVNFAPCKTEGHGLAYGDFIDFQLCSSQLEWYPDHLRLDESYIKVLTLKDPPTQTRAHLFKKIEELPGNIVITNEWKRESNAKMRSLMQSKRRHFHNSKASLMNYMSKDTPQPGQMLIDEGATAMVGDIGEAQKAMEVSGLFFGEFSTSIVIYGPDLASIRHTASECIKVFSEQGAQLTEERYNLLNAYLATIPGNADLNLRRIYLSSANAADLSLVYSPKTGAQWNSFLRAEYLAMLETRQGTPFYLNLHHGDVGHGLILGTTGAGKSFLLCFLLMQLQKYRPFTFVFDLGGSYKSLASLLGGAYLKFSAGSRSVSINPFCLPLSPDNHQFLYSLVRVLIESSGYRLTAQDERDIYSQIQNLYEIDPSQRRLGTLSNILSRPLGDALTKWVGDGQYGSVFDNAEDTLTFSRFQVFEFESKKENQELLEPLLFYILHRASTVVDNPANSTTLKVAVVDEAWLFFKNPVVREYILGALKTWRKHNAAMILATQSGEDLTRSEMLATVAENCPTKLFLSNPEMDEEAYSRIFHLNGVETEAMRSLIPKREFLLKRPDGSKVLKLEVDAKSYWLYTSDPFDAERRQQAFDQYGLVKGLEILSQEKK